jgi:hypothetical protein
MNLPASPATRRFIGAVALGVIALCGGSRDLHAQYKGHDFGLGLRFGDPTALSAKYWLSANDALQFDLGWQPAYRYQTSTYLVYDPSPVLSVDWVHQFTRFGPASRRVWFGAHVGVGGTFGYATPDACYYDAFNHYYCESAVTVHVPIAFNVYLAAVRLGFFAEIAPGIRFYPPLAPTLSFSLGARYYF